MILTLEVTGAQAATLGAATRKVFDKVGGAIGRLPSNYWVLPHPYVSSRHALIRYRDGVFSIEDTKSANGIFINSPENRLPQGERYELKTGDSIFIDPFHIHASIAAETPSPSLLDPFAQDDVFASNAPSLQPGIPPYRPDVPARSDPFGGDEVDPMNLLGFEAKRPAVSVPKASDLAGRSVLSDDYRPPSISSPALPPQSPSPRQSHDSPIPADYDPLGSDSQLMIPHSPAVRPPSRSNRAAASPPTPAPGDPASYDRPVRPRVTSSGMKRPVDPPSQAARQTPVTPAAPVVSPVAAPPKASGSGAIDLASILAGAGLEHVAVPPDLARSFGQIFRVVVSGVMDILQSRQRIKQEFRIPGTVIEPLGNNPLKFSANLDDALYNLLVKRNAAWLGPVEAFEDAFDDLRNHQMAMLVGLRKAFDAMLAEFHPERLEKEFDGQGKKGSLLSVPAKLRYWDLYRDRFGDMVKDTEASFAELFGDEFARAYEEQLLRLKKPTRKDKR